MRFTKSHEWVRLEGNIATVGVTDFAQKELGEVVYVDLPKVGAMLKMGEEASVLESTKAATDSYAPVSGKVVAVNDLVAQTPQLINRSAEDKGWLFKLQISNQKEWNTLLSKDDYLTLVSS